MQLEATQSSGQYFTNQGYALVPPNQNPIMNTTQNYRYSQGRQFKYLF